MAVGLSEITCNFDVTNVIMIYQAQKEDSHLTSYTTQLPVQEREVQFQIFL
jgi:hypothetical protein